MFATGFSKSPVAMSESLPVPEFECKKCNAMREHPFCHKCGSRLTLNAYIGRSEISLTYCIQSLHEEMRVVREGIEAAERQFAKKMEPERTTLQKLSATYKEMQDACEYARRNKITDGES